MAGETKIYPKDTVFQLLLSGRAVASVINEWWETHTEADVRVRRAKTKGCAVLETKSTVFAAHIIKLWPGTKVNVKEPARQNRAAQ